MLHDQLRDSDTVRQEVLTDTDSIALLSSQKCCLLEDIRFDSGTVHQSYTFVTLQPVMELSVTIKRLKPVTYCRASMEVRDVGRVAICIGSNVTVLEALECVPWCRQLGVLHLTLQN